MSARAAGRLLLDDLKTTAPARRDIFVAGAGGFVCGKSEDSPEWDAIRDVSQFRNS